MDQATRKKRTPRKRARSPLIKPSSPPHIAGKRIRIRGPTREGHARSLAAATQAARMCNAQVHRIGRQPAEDEIGALFRPTRPCASHLQPVQRQPLAEEKNVETPSPATTVEGRLSGGSGGKFSDDDASAPASSSSQGSVSENGDVVYVGITAGQRQGEEEKEVTPQQPRRGNRLPQVTSLEEVSDDAIVAALTSLLEQLVKENEQAGRARTCDEAEERLRLFFSKSPQSFPLDSYVERVVLNVPSRPVLVMSLALLDRLHDNHDHLALSESNMHRVFMTAVMLAYKFLEDEPCSQDFFRIIGGIPSLDELNDLEAEFLRQIDWRCSVEGDLHERYGQTVLNRVFKLFPAGVPRLVKEEAPALSS